MKTTIINIWAGPGFGKSTLASGLFHLMKSKGYNVELVQEAAKEWAWQNKPIATTLDQMTVGFDQLMREERLIGKVEYIITDSPVEMNEFYSNYFNIDNPLISTFEEIMYNRKRDQHTTIHFFINTNKPYDPRGRYQTEAESKAVHAALYKWLDVNKCYKLIELDNVEKMTGFITSSP